MIIALNNKCNLEKNDFLQYQKELEKISTKQQLILFPSTIHLASFQLREIELGSQNVGTNNLGAYTGEISVQQLKSYGVNYCIIGHSERREHQKETSTDINKKIKQLLVYGITPILCIGETLEQKKQGKTANTLEIEIIEGLAGLGEEEKERIIVAYEPIWSIGTGNIPLKDEIKEIITLIQKHLPKTKILYGGSVNEENIDIIKKYPCIDGYLIGGLSLKPDKLQIFLDKLDN